MELVDDKAISRGMVRVDQGEDLVDSLKALAKAARWDDAFVSGAGQLDLVELEIGESSYTYENAQLTSLAGRIMRRGDGHQLTLNAALYVNGQLHCGRIAAAMTGGLLLVVDAVSDRARRENAPTVDSAASRATIPAATPVAAQRPALSRPLPAPTGGDSERDASQPLSESFSTKPVVQRPSGPKLDLDDDENPIVDTGDFVDHPQLGLCEVVGDDGGGIKIRVGSGKTRVLRLEALHVLPGEEDDEGRMVFKITGPRRQRRY